MLLNLLKVNQTKQKLVKTTQFLISRKCLGPISTNWDNQIFETHILNTRIPMSELHQPYNYNYCLILKYLFNPTLYFQ